MAAVAPTPGARGRLLIALGAGALVACLILLGLAQRMDTWLHDRTSGAISLSPDPRIVIVAVDEKSLAELGRWPWSRRTHARLVDELARLGVQGTGLDLLLSEPALFDPEGDALLARALHRNGRVVLPVLAEPAQPDGAPVELLPIPEFAASAAALGHVDVSADADGVVRSAWLRAGQGSARWPSLSLALAQLNGPGGDTLPGERNEAIATPPTAPHWLRDYRVLVPFARTGEGFTRLSYADVINRRVAAAQLQDRYVLVGATAPDMGDRIRVPGAVSGRELDGVEYEANVLNMLLQNKAITPLSLGPQLLWSILLVTLPMLLYGLPGFRSIGRAIALAIGLTLVSCYALLKLGHLWFPASATLLVLLAGAGVCGWRALRHRRHASQTDSITGLINRGRFQHLLDQEVRTAQRSQLPISLLLLDVDQFRGLNERHGMAGGDAVLRTLARVLRGRARRPRDLIARVGGDEFAVLLPETSSQAAATIATTIHVDLANLAARDSQANDELPAFTASIGIHTVQAGENFDAGELFERADAALHHARQGGHRRSHRDPVPVSAARMPPAL